MRKRPGLLTSTWEDPSAITSPLASATGWLRCRGWELTASATCWPFTRVPFKLPMSTSSHLDTCSSFSFCEHLTSQLYLENPQTHSYLWHVQLHVRDWGAGEKKSSHRRGRTSSKINWKTSRRNSSDCLSLVQWLPLTCSVTINSSHVQRASSLSLLRYWLHQLPTMGNKWGMLRKPILQNLFLEFLCISGSNKGGRGRCSHDFGLHSRDMCF